MKRLVVIASLAVVVVGFFGREKIGVWLGVARQSLVDRIESSLGEYRVRRESVRRKIASLEQALERVHLAEKTAETRSEEIEGKLATIERRLQGGKEVLARLREGIGSDQAVELAGRTRSPKEQRKLVEDLLPLCEALQTQAGSYARVRDVLNRSAAKLRDDRARGKETLDSIRREAELVDARLGALEAVREAATIAGASDGSLAKQFQQLQTEIDELTVKVGAEAKLEDEKWAELAERSSKDLDAILREASGEDIVGRIDRLLERER